jgi:lipopolysaccharide export system protein LptA
MIRTKANFHYSDALRDKRVFMENISNICLICILFLFSQYCFALSTDKQQIIKLSANSADINQESHKGIYTTDVSLDQGSTHLRANRAITHTDSGNKLIKAIIFGNHQFQAHFWTLIDEKKQALHAYADSIYYFPEKHLIQLNGNARVEQGSDSFSAPQIDFDTLNQHVVSRSNHRKQTVIIIHPENQHERTSSPTSAKIF